MADISREYNICKDSYWKCEDPIIEVLFTWTSLPDWFHPINHGTEEEPYYVFDFEFTPDTTGTFTITISGEEGFTGTITINVTDCGDGYNHCPDGDDMNIAWFNRASGWNNYIFHGEKTKGVETGKASTFKNSDMVLKYAERVGVFDQWILTTDNVPKPHIDYLDGLRGKTIQAFMWNDSTNLWDIPIFVIFGSYNSWQSKDQLFKASVRILLAEEIIIQKQ